MIPSLSFLSCHDDKSETAFLLCRHRPNDISLPLLLSSFLSKIPSRTGLRVDGFCFKHFLSLPNHDILNEQICESMHEINIRVVCFLSDWAVYGIVLLLYYLWPSSVSIIIIILIIINQPRNKRQTGQIPKRNESIHYQRRKPKENGNGCIGEEEQQSTCPNEHIRSHHTAHSVLVFGKQNLFLKVAVIAHY